MLYYLGLIVKWRPKSIYFVRNVVASLIIFRVKILNSYQVFLIYILKELTLNCLIFLGNITVCNGKGMKCIESISNFTSIDSCAPSCNEVEYQTATSSAKISDLNLVAQIYENLLNT